MTARPPVLPPPAPSQPVAPPPGPRPVPPRIRRLSPQQVLLGVGTLLLVAGAGTFVALAWDRLGLAFQATVMLLVTVAAGAVSASTARRSLRATEEALAAAGAALLGIDLGAAWAKNLFGIGELPLRSWSAAACLVGVAVCAALARLTRSTATWPLAALLATQPVPFLLLPPGAVDGPAGLAAALGLAALDLAAAVRLRPLLVPAASCLALLWTAVSSLGGIALTMAAGPGRAWATTAVLAASGAVALPWARTGRLPAGSPSPLVVAPVAAGIVGLAAGFSARVPDPAGPVTAASTGLALLCAAVLVAGHAVPARGLLAGGAALDVAAVGVLLDSQQLLPLSVVVLAAALPAALAAVRLPRVRPQAAAAALAAPALSVLLARGAGSLSPTAAALLLALVGAVAFAVAAARARRPEDPWCAALGVASGLAAALVADDAGALGQEALALAVVGAAAACYGAAGARRWVVALAVGDLVVAAWLAAGAAGIRTPEAYSLPAALGLLVVLLPQLRGRASSWAAEGPVAAVALVPSAVVAVTDPTATRLALVLVAAVALTVAGTLTHRQAPFVIGTATLAFEVLGRLGPYAPLLPRWVLFTTAGLVLLAVGATYERRRQQAREAVAWVAQMR